MQSTQAGAVSRVGVASPTGKVGSCTRGNCFLSLSPLANEDEFQKTDAHSLAFI